MTIMGKINNLGNSVCSYTPGTILFNGTNGEAATINLKKGLYYIRGQGGGGGGGDNIYYGNGGGGGSGAGFEGNIYIPQNLLNIEVKAGLAGPRKTAGTASFISNLLIMGGAECGITDNPIAGAGGILEYAENLNIKTYKVKSNGLPGNQTNGPNGTKGGANSVLTNSGAGIANGNSIARNASAPGAGAAGGIQWDAAGGNGGSGELLIKYLQPKT